MGNVSENGVSYTDIKDNLYEYVLKRGRPIPLPIQRMARR